jgi:hypothetical protein
MLSKKYAKDYEVEYEKTPSGRLKARAVYKGRFYGFSDTGERLRKTAVYFAVLSAAAWTAFLVPLFILSSTARTSYVIIPHACLFLPLVSISSVTVSLWTAKPPLTREKSDHISRRAPKSTLFMVLFSGVASLGYLIRLFQSMNTMRLGDMIFGLCEAVLLTVSCLLFLARRRTDTREMM